MNVLVTGGAGYLGNVVAPVLLRAGHEVTIVDTFRHRKYVVPSSAKVIGRDAANVSLGGYDAILNLAAITGERACQEAPKDARRINGDLPHLLAGKMSAGQFMVHASTTAVYGDVGSHFIDKVDPALNDGLSLYQHSKLRGERDLGVDDNIAVVRIPTLYGLSSLMREEILIHDMCRQAVETGSVEVWGEIYAVRPLGHVSDVADALLRIMEKKLVGVHLLAAENRKKFSIALDIATASGAGIETRDRQATMRQDHAVLNVNLQKQLADNVSEVIDFYKP